MRTGGSFTQNAKSILMHHRLKDLLNLHDNSSRIIAIKLKICYEIYTAVLNQPMLNSYIPMGKGKTKLNLRTI